MAGKWLAKESLFLAYGWNRFWIFLTYSLTSRSHLGDSEGLHFCFSFGITPSSAQDLVLAVQSGISPGSLRDYLGCQGLCPGRPSPRQLVLLTGTVSLLPSQGISVWFGKQWFSLHRNPFHKLPLGRKPPYSYFVCLWDNRNSWVSTNTFSLYYGSLLKHTPSSARFLWKLCFWLTLQSLVSVFDTWYGTLHRSGNSININHDVEPR